MKAAIAEAERDTSGEIRVSVSTFFWGDVRQAAERAFDRLGMTATAPQRGPLLRRPVPPAFVVLGDEGIHAKVGQELLGRRGGRGLRPVPEGRLHRRPGPRHREAGRALAIHFPYERTPTRNELPDDVDFGE